MAERIPADMDAFLREHAARATPLQEVREAALARWPHASDATDEQRRTHAARIETAYKHRRKRARGEARAALADSVLSPALDAVAVAPEADPEIQIAPSRQTVKIDSGRTDADSLATPTADVNLRAGDDAARGEGRVKIVGPNGQEWAWVSESGILPGSRIAPEELQEMVDAFKRAQQVISVRSDIERLEGVVDNLATQVGRLADAVSQMLAQAADVGAAKDALIETQKRYIEHLQRMVGA